MKLVYFFVRLWAPPSETSDPEEPHYVQRIDGEGETKWTTTRSYADANFFQSLKTAVRVMRGVARLAGRIEHGWLYEIIRVEEEIMASNVPEEETEPTCEV